MGCHGITWENLNYNAQSLGSRRFLGLHAVLGRLSSLFKYTSPCRNINKTLLGLERELFVLGIFQNNKRTCQTAYKPGSVRDPVKDRATTIHLGRPLPSASRDRPGRLARERALLALRPTYRPYLVLLPKGFAVPPPLPEARCALTAPFHPCRRNEPKRATPAVCSLWHCPWGRPRRALPGFVFPWSPDFPPPPEGEGGRPAVWRLIAKRLGLWNQSSIGSPARPSSDLSCRWQAPSHTSSMRVGRKCRWNARATEAVSASKRSSAVRP